MKPPTENTGQKITVFDTTLRDGVQGPGYAMTPAAKMAVARKLQDMNVDVIEAGYASNNETMIRDIAFEVRRPIICSLAMSKDASIEAAARALEGADKSRIHLYHGLSPTHRKARGLSPDQVINASVAAVQKATFYFSDIQFSPEDATRTEWELLVCIAKAVYAEGARTFNVPDTVGFMTSQKIKRLFRYLYDNISEVRSGAYILSTHTHNDKGLALANALASIEGGARQIEGTLLGIGERTGNMATEQGVMSIRLNGEDYESPFGIPHVDHIDTTHIYPACLVTSEAAHHPVPKNQTYIGENAFNTESGTHVHLLNKDSTTYYIIDPAMIGRGPAVISVGSQSGRNALFQCTVKLGYSIPEEQKERYFEKFMEYAESKREYGGTVSPDELIQRIYLPMMTGNSE